MNIAANILGLGNAATPLGIRAMKDLETLNPRPGTATNAMCTFLAICTSSIQLVPVTAMAILAANHSTNPSAIVGTSIIATTCAALSGVTMAKLLERLPIFRLPPVPIAAAPSRTEEKSSPDSEPTKLPIREAENLQPLQWWGRLILVGFALFFAYFFVRLAFPAALNLPVPDEMVRQNTFVRIVGAISTLSVPLLLSIFPLYAVLRRVKVYEEFVDGAREGFEVGVKIIPYLVAILVAIGIFRAAGGIDLLSKALAPAMAFVGFPTDLLPLVLMRPLSGSGTLGVFTELVQHLGPDHLVSRMA